MTELRLFVFDVQNAAVPMLHNFVFRSEPGRLGIRSSDPVALLFQSSKWRPGRPVPQKFIRMILSYTVCYSILYFWFLAFLLDLLHLWVRTSLKGWWNFCRRCGIATPIFASETRWNQRQPRPEIQKWYLRMSMMELRWIKVFQYQHLNNYIANHCFFRSKYYIYCDYYVKTFKLVSTCFQTCFDSSPVDWNDWEDQHDRPDCHASKVLGERWIGEFIASTVKGLAAKLIWVMSGRSGLISRSCQIEQAAGRTLVALMLLYLGICMHHHASFERKLESIASIGLWTFLLTFCLLPGVSAMSEGRSDFFAELAQNISYEASDYEGWKRGYNVD